MVRTIEIPADQLAIKGDKIELTTSALPGRVLSVKVEVDDEMPAQGSVSDPASKPFDEWEKEFNEMCALAPENEFPADVSRENMYLSDEELGYKAE